MNNQIIIVQLRCTVQVEMRLYEVMVVKNKNMAEVLLY